MSSYFFAFLAMFFWGIAPIFGKLALADLSPMVGLTLRTFSIFVILLIYGLVSGELGQLGNINWRSGLYMAGEGILASLLGHLAYLYALKYGAASRVVPFTAAYPLVAVLIASIFLGEKITWSKGAGALFVVVGLILLKK